MRRYRLPGRLRRSPPAGPVRDGNPDWCGVERLTPGQIVGKVERVVSGGTRVAIRPRVHGIAQSFRESRNDQVPGGTGHVPGRDRQQVNTRRRRKTFTPRATPECAVEGIVHGHSFNRQKEGQQHYAVGLPLTMRGIRPERENAGTGATLRRVRLLRSRSIYCSVVFSSDSFRVNSRFAVLASCVEDRYSSSAPRAVRSVSPMTICAGLVRSSQR